MSEMSYGVGLSAIESWLYFVAVWCGALWAVSWLSGWRALAETYPMRELPLEPIEWHGWQYGVFRFWCGYKGCLWIGSCRQGLILKTGPGPLFRLAHPTILIPWESLTIGESTSFFLRKMAPLQVRGMDFLIRLSAKPMEQARQYWLATQPAKP